MPIKLAENFRAVFYAPFYAAQSLGFYASEGVEVELVNSSSPGDGVSALLNDAIDITWGGPMRVMKAHDLQPSSPLVCFCEVVGRDPFYLVGRHHRPEFQLRELASLRFARVAEVATPWMCLQHDLREQGVDPSRLNRAPDRSMARSTWCNSSSPTQQWPWSWARATSSMPPVREGRQSIRRSSPRSVELSATAMRLRACRAPFHV